MSLPTRALRLSGSAVLSRTRTAAAAARSAPSVVPFLNQNKNFHSSPYFLTSKANQPSPGEFSRTDPKIKTTYPGDDSSELPSSTLSPTLPSFSLQGKVVVITGGARGLGLVMGRMFIHHPISQSMT